MVYLSRSYSFFFLLYAIQPTLTQTHTSLPVGCPREKYLNNYVHSHRNILRGLIFCMFVHIYVVYSNVHTLYAYLGNTYYITFITITELYSKQQMCSDNGTKRNCMCCVIVYVYCIIYKCIFTFSIHWNVVMKNLFCWATSQKKIDKKERKKSFRIKKCFSKASFFLSFRIC